MITILIILKALIISFVIWFFASRRHTRPCPAWLSWMVEMDNPFTKVNRASTIIQHLDVRPGMRILDAGCGPGRLTIPLSRAVGPHGEVIALDIQQKMLDKVRKKAEQASISNINYLNMGLGQGQLTKNHFDRIVLVTVLGEIPESQKAMKELYAALADDGILSITELIFDPHFQRQTSVLKLAKQAGFTQKAIFGNVFSYTMHFEKIR